MTRQQEPALLGAIATRLLCARPMMPMMEQDLDREFSVVAFSAEDTPASLGEAAAGIVIAVTTGEAGLTGDQIRAIPDLRAIVNFGAGYDATDVAIARERGIKVSNTPDVLTDCVADMAVGLLINVLRGLSAADRFVRRGQWETGPFQLTAKVTGKRVGIVGLGRIGRTIARRLEAFDMTISYHNRRPVDGVPYRYVSSVEGLASECDILVVAVQGGPESAGLISREVLAALGPAGYLINIARGSVVDEPALVRALSDGTIAGAGLDVFANEPHVHRELFAMENVVLLPHVGSGTLESRRSMADLVLANIRQFQTDGTLVTPIN